MKLLMDPTIYNRLDTILCGVSKQLPKIDRIFNDAESFMDTLARHPEKLGIRGAIAPSDGTKKNQDLPPLDNNLPPPATGLLHR